MTRTQQATYFRLRASGYELAAQVAEALDSLDGDDEDLARECDPRLPPRPARQRRPAA